MKIPCTACGAMILETTAARTDGLCMPCKTGTRASIEAGKAYHKRERELNATDPSRIYWRSLVDRVHNTSAGLGGLSDAEKQYWAVACLSGEVYNGGFHQFFHNSSGELYAWAMSGLEAMEAAKSQGLLARAKQILFGFRDVPKSTLARRQTLAGSDIDDRRLDELDKLFWSDPDNLGERSQNFALKHKLFCIEAQQGAQADGPAFGGPAA